MGKMKSRVGWQAGRPRQSRVETEFGPMPPRMAEVLYMALRGDSGPVLAEKLGVSLKGLKYHLTNIYAAAGVSCRMELIAKWQKIKGITPMPNLVITVEIPDLPRGGQLVGSVVDREFEGDC